MFELRPHKFQVKQTTGGGTLPNGDPQPVETVWSEKRECRYDSDSRETIKFTVDGPVAKYSYVVLIDPTCEVFEGQFIRLLDMYDNQVAEMPVQKQVNGKLRTKLYL